MQTPITLIKGDKHGSEVDYRDNLPENMYAIPRNILSAGGYLTNYPGLTSFGTGTGIDRGAIYNERFRDQYRISGTRLISVSASGVVVDLGFISGLRQAALPYSFNTQAIVVDQKMWLFSPGGGLNQVVDGDLGKPIDCTWVNGYYFLTDGEYIYHTNITSETSIDPLKFATAEFMPDPSLGVAKTQDNKVMVFGRYSIEYFADVAQTNFAFTRIETRAQKIGIVATHAKCEGINGFYITGGHKNEIVGVHLVRANQSMKISTREVDIILAQYTEPQLSDMRMECYKDGDITFILIHLPDHVLCFNETVTSWSILKTDIKTNIPYRGINGVYDARNVKWVYGDKIDSSIGVLDKTVPTHYGEQVEWILFTPFINLETLSIDKIEIDTIPGFTVILDATVALSLTHDGVQFGEEYWMDYGDPSEYGKRFITRRLGYVRDWIGFKFRGVSKSKMAFALMKITYS